MTGRAVQCGALRRGAAPCGAVQCVAAWCREGFYFCRRGLTFS